jgi:hypothetical protein
MTLHSSPPENLCPADRDTYYPVFVPLWSLLSPDELNELAQSKDVVHAVRIKSRLRNRVWTLLEEECGHCGTSNARTFAQADADLDDEFEKVKAKHYAHGTMLVQSLCDGIQTADATEPSV